MKSETQRRLRSSCSSVRAWMTAGLGIALAGCGGKVVVDAGPSGGSATVGAGGAGSTSGGVGGAVGSGGAGGGSVMPGICSAQNGIECPPDQFCDYPDDGCGNGQGKINGVCAPRPQACPLSFQPACGCDMKVHETPCDAESEGADLSTVEWCVPPPGMFQCGAFFCTVGKEYCEHLVVNQGESETASCKPLPPCGASCDCLLSVTCGSACTGTPEGGAEIYCPAGG